MDGLRLVLYVGGSSDTIAVRELVALGPGAGVEADIGASAISIVVDGRERLADRLSLGPLEHLFPQLAPAAERIGAGRVALVRSAVLDVEDGHYLLFEPTGDTVAVSAVSFDDLPASGWFPNGPDAERLYAYVGAHREPLLASARSRGVAPVELALERAGVEASLADGAQAAAELLAAV